MSYHAPSTPSLQSTERISQDAQHRESQRNSPHTASIHILDDDSLLNVFYLYRPTIFDGDEDDDDRLRGGRGWDRERWWYKLAHVCQRWRNLVLGSASHLRLSLVCTYGTPVTDMLAHSPPLPLVIDYFHANPDMITAEDEEGIIVALEQRDRVRRVRLEMPIPNLQKLTVAFDDEYPALEYLIITNNDSRAALALPETLQAPHLRHLALVGFVLPIGCRLLTSAVGLVTLALVVDPPSAYFRPNTLLQWLSFMPQLETLLIGFSFPVPNPDVERQLVHRPIMTHITLPNLRWFLFQGVSTYLEAVLHRITTPRLELLRIQFFNQLTFSVPRLLQFMTTTENTRFDSARIEFLEERVRVEFHHHEEADKYTLSIFVDCWHLDWQVASVVQIFNSLSQIFSTVEHLTLEHEVHSWSSEEHNEVDRNEWRKLLRSFRNVKTLHVEDGLVKGLSRSLRVDDGEFPLELLPELQDLTYSGSSNDAFTSFVDTRQNVGRPVTLVLTPISRSSSPGVSEPSPLITSGIGEAVSDLDT